MNELLDSHVLLWWLLDSPELSPAHAAHLEKAAARGVRVGVSAITLWEIAKLAQLGRIQLKITVDEVLAQIEADPLFEVLPITGRIAAESTRLGPSFHKDPADQIIAATARVHGLAILTRDRRILASGVVAAF